MAKMIPPEIPDSAPRSEKTIFNNLMRAPRDWMVFHSKQVRNPQNSEGPPREIDFLILIPQPYFCVICLEVKGGSYEIREDGMWYRLHNGESQRSPLDQSSSAMFTLKNKFKSCFGLGSPLTLECAVAFTNVTKPDTIPEDLEDHLAETIWSDDDLCEKLIAYAKGKSTKRRPKTDQKVRSAEKKWHTLRCALEPKTMTIATQPETIFRTDLEDLRPQLLELTNEQFTSLNRVEWNPRCVIDGAAGTGKTVLAMELAKRRYGAGETIALLCSNPYLSRRLVTWAEILSGRTKPERIMKRAKKILSGNKGKIVAGTPAKLPFEVFKGDPTLSDMHRERLTKWPRLEESLKLGYLADEWHKFIKETVVALGQEGIFDYLIVDEAQNLYDEAFLDLMDALLKGGLKKGRWTMFGDFTNQNLVSSRLPVNGLDELRKVLEDRKLDWSTDKLDTNCRNTQEISEAVARLVDIESPPMSGVHGPLVQIEYFKSLEELGDLLDSLVLNFKDKHFLSRQIILLSSGSGTEFNTERNYGGWKLLNIREETVPALRSREDVLVYDNTFSGNTLRYSDVYDFQGLESNLVILVLPVTDDQVVLAGGITLPREEHLNRMLYTGMSRAKTMLVVVAHESYRETLEDRWELYD